MYKSNFLAQIVRSTRAQPFFSQNVANANTTALLLAKPNLGLAAERSYFSSWSQNGPNASNTNSIYSTQSTYTVIAVNDDNTWDFANRRHKPRVLTRRASTGLQNSPVQATTQASTERFTIDDASIDSTPSRAASLEAQDVSDLESELVRLLASGSYKEALTVYENDPFDDSSACQHSYLTAIDRLDSKKAPLNSPSNWLVSRILSFVDYIEKNDIELNGPNTNLVLRILLRHRGDERRSRVALEEAASHQAPEEVLRSLQQAHDEAKEEATARRAIGVYQNSSCSTEIEAELLEHLLHACRLTGASEEALSVYETLRNLNIVISPYAYQTMIELFGDIGDVASAIECFNEWKLSGSESVHDNADINLSLFSALLSAKDLKKAMAFIQQLLDSDKDFRDQNLLLILTQLAHANMVAEAEALYKTYSNLISQNDFQVTILQAALTRNDLYAAKKSFALIQDLRVIQDSRHVTDLYLTSLTEQGYIDEAFETLTLLQSHNMAPKLTTVVTLMQRILTAGRISVALDMSSAHLMHLLKYASAQDVHAFLSSISQLFASKADLSINDVMRVLETLQMTDQNLDINNADKILTNLESQLDHSKLTSNMLVELYKLQHYLENDTLKDSLAGHIDWLAAITNTANMTTSPASSTSIVSKNASTSSMSSTTNLLEHLPERHWVSPYVLTNDPFFSLRRMVNAQQHYTDDASRILQLVQHLDSRALDHSGDLVPRAILVLGQLRAKEALSAIAEHFESYLSTSLVSLENRLLSGWIYDSLIIASNDCGDNVLANKYLQKLYSIGYCPGAATYASFVAKMENSLYQDCASRALEVLNEAKTHEVVPNEFLMNTVIAKLAKARRNDEALSLFHEMKQIGLEPNEVTYGTVINSCCRVGRGPEAEQLLVELERRGQGKQTRVAPYNTLMQYYIQTEANREKALFFWRKLSSTTIQPTSHTFRLLIEAFGHIAPADPFAAESVMAEMRARGMPVEGVHHAALLYTYGVSLNELEQAKNYFNFVLSNRLCAAQDTLPLYQCMLQIALHHHDSGCLQTVLHQMRHNNIRPNAYITNLAIKGLAEIGDIGQARYMFDSLPVCASAFGREPSTYTAMIEAYQSNNHPVQANEIYALLERQNFPVATMRKAQEALMKRYD